MVWQFYYRQETQQNSSNPITMLTECGGLPCDCASGQDEINFKPVKDLGKRVGTYSLRYLLTIPTELPAGLFKFGVVTKIRIFFQKILAFSFDHFTMLIRPNI